ncbi:hypothetical protein NDU88_005371 [Pleurodeles waltl]|uniref:Uncharacterized protein n=1 Tax=Pleurodeles waltl TaxID=8319 RepID=A0AAV7RJF5_PLEWA|nr:hypothetical protein NDU88_005371 [Pleurodeles waltl]
MSCLSLGGICPVPRKASCHHGNDDPEEKSLNFQGEPLHGEASPQEQGAALPLLEGAEYGEFLSLGEGDELPTLQCIRGSLEVGELLLEVAGVSVSSW